ncbi:hypothetical protein [Rhodococcoides kroppenstedtii]|uniref:hypothetical protein n=1 Tax=Rhodococcoides kroppenstedtii TaxID=293050 RepID=UPI001113314B|nr:hypothetical protein [Rhodococcus kroppenstedtii]
MIEALWSPAIGTLHNILESGRIITSGPVNAAMRIDYRDLELMRIDHDSRDDLSVSMAVAALPDFVTNVVDGRRWDRSQSSLLTYFVNACLLRKVPVVNQWTRPHRAARRLVARADTDTTNVLTIEMSDVPYARTAAERLVAEASPQVPTLLAALLRGETTSSAAREMGISAGSARSMLFRFRKGVVVPLVAAGVLEPMPGTVVANLHYYTDGDDYAPYAPSASSSLSPTLRDSFDEQYWEPSAPVDVNGDVDDVF